MCLSGIDKKAFRKTCLSNAESLLKEATILFNNKKYARATFLAIISYEEALKASLIASLELKFMTESEFKKIWNKHESKFLSAYKRIRVKIDEMKSGITKESYIPEEGKEIVKAMIKTRNNALYVGLAKNSITNPKELSFHTANRFIKIARRKLDWELLFDSLINKIENNDN